MQVQVQVSSLWQQEKHRLVRCWCWRLRSEQAGKVGPTTHLEARCDPLQTQCAFLPKPTRNLDLVLITFATDSQLRFLPPKPDNVSLQNPFTLGGSHTSAMFMRSG